MKWLISKLVFPSLLGISSASISAERYESIANSRSKETPKWEKVSTTNDSDKKQEVWAPVQDVNQNVLKEKEIDSAENIDYQDQGLLHVKISSGSLLLTIKGTNSKVKIETSEVNPEQTEWSGTLLLNNKTLNDYSEFATVEEPTIESLKLTPASKLGYHLLEVKSAEGYFIEEPIIREERVGLALLFKSYQTSY